MKFEMITEDDNGFDIIENDDNKDDYKLKGDDQVLTDLFRDDSLMQDLLIESIDNNKEKLEEKTGELYKIIIDMNSIIEEYTLNLIQFAVDNGFDIPAFPKDITMKYKSKFVELRLKAVDLRNPKNKVEWTDECYKQYVYESGNLFDVYVNTTINAFLASLKNNGDDE